MALVKDNDLTDGLSGKFGRKIVFRVVKGVTVAARRSTKERVPNPVLTEGRIRFKRAVNYARAKMLDPIAKAEYKAMAGTEAFANPFAAAVRDYMKAPVIEQIETSDFTGAAGSLIPIMVSDNAKVIRIKVAFVDNTAAVIESGEATYTRGDVEWIYTTKQPLPSLAGIKMVVTAIDRPGNQTTFEHVLG